MALTRPRAYQIYDIDYKQAVRVVATTNVTLAGGAPNTVDGVNLSLNDRILVVGQSSAVQNGIYYVTTVGTGANGTWARSVDTDTTGELLSGTIVMVTEGTTYADTQWKLTTDDPISIGSTALTFVQNYLANSISYGQTSFAIGSSNANATISVAGTSNVAVFSTLGQSVEGNITATGNVGAANLTASDQLSVSSTATVGTLQVGASGIASRLTTNGTGFDDWIGINKTTGNIFVGGSSQTGFVSLGQGTSNSIVYIARGETTNTLIKTVSIGDNGLAGSNTSITVGNTAGRGNVTIGANTLFTISNTSGSALNVVGNVTGGNLTTAGIVSATGNITSSGNVSATYLLGNVYYATGFSASKIYNGTSEINIGTSGGAANVSIGGTSNVAVFSTIGVAITGELTTSGLISATGNITSVGNISGSYILGNGSQLTGIVTGNSFGVITVSGQSNVVADQATDTLALAAGTGISITTDASTDTITISSIATDSIFATGGEMGTIGETVTTSEDLGLVTDAATVQYDLGTETTSGIVTPSLLLLPSYTVAQLGNLTASPAGQFVFCSNESGGSIPAFSDGTNWRRVSDRAIVT